MKQNLLQRLGNPLNKMFFKEPSSNLEDHREKNLTCKSALERIDKSNKKLKRKEKDLKRVIQMYGHNRVAHLLSNSTNYYKEDEIHLKNKLWAGQYSSYGFANRWEREGEYAKKFIPDTSKDFALKVNGSCLNWLIEKTESLEIKRKLVEIEQIQLIDLEEDFEELKGNIVALYPSTLQSPFAKEKSQLWILLEKEEKDETIRARNLSTGVEMNLNPNMIMGTVKEGHLPPWAVKKQEKLLGISVENLTYEEKLFENGKPFLGPSIKNYRTLSLTDNVLLVAESTRKNEIHFSTWKMENNKPCQKHDYGTDLEGAKKDFAERSGVVKMPPILSFEELLEAKSKDTPVETKEEVKKVSIPNLTEEESAMYLKLCEKIQNQTPEPLNAEADIEEIVKTVKNNLEKLSVDAENVKEWNNGLENTPEKQFNRENPKYDRHEEYQQFQDEYSSQNSYDQSYSQEFHEEYMRNQQENPEMTQRQQENQENGQKEKPILIPLDPSEALFQSGKDFEFTIKSNSKILSQMGETALVAMKNSENDINFLVCHINNEQKRVTPLTSTTKNVDMAKEAYAQKSGIVSAMSMVSDSEKMVIYNACAYVLDTVDQVPEQDRSVLNSLLDKFQINEEFLEEVIAVGEER